MLYEVITRLEQQESYNETEVQLDTLIASLLQEFEELMAGRQIAVNLHCESICISADREKIARVIINLLDNAVKYNFEKGGQIVV